MNLRNSSALTLAVKFGGQALQLLYAVVLARIMAIEEYGIVTYALVLLNTFSPVFLLGYDRTAMRYGARYLVEDDSAKLKGLLRTGRAVAVFASVVALATAIALWALGILDWADGKDQAVLLALAQMPLWAVAMLHRSFQRGLRKVFRALVGFHIIRPFVAFVLTAMVLIWMPRPAATLVMALMAVATVINLVFDEWSIRQSPVGKAARADVTERRAWRETSQPLLVSGVMTALAQRGDMVIVGAMLGMAPTAVYGVAVRLATLAVFALDGVRFAVAPMIAEAYHAKDMSGVQKYLNEASQWIFLATLPVALPLIVAPHFFMGIFGDEYRSGALVLVLLALAQVANAWAGTVAVLLTMTEYEKIHSRIITVSTLLYFAGLYAGVKLGGIVGAALATALFMLVRNLALVIAARRLVGLRSYYVPRKPRWSEFQDLMNARKRRQSLNASLKNMENQDDEV